MLLAKPSGRTVMVGVQEIEPSGALEPVLVVRPLRRPLRVLLADDNRDSTDSLAELLRLSGCDVRGCYDGGAVLPLAASFRPDACVLDVRMPVLDGWAVAPLLRAWAGGRPLLLIALTGLGERQHKANSLAAGFDHHLVKPTDLRVLCERLSNFVARLKPAVPGLLSGNACPHDVPLLPAFAGVL
jgi:DNA-binding response OmpR family regulator